MFAAPFPGPDLMHEGRIRIGAYPGRNAGPTYLSALGGTLSRWLGDDFPPGPVRGLASELGFVDNVLDVLERDTRGFGLNSGVFFSVSVPDTGADRGSLGDRLSGVVFNKEDHRDWAIPNREASVRDGATVFLMNVDPGSAEYLRKHPVDVSFSRRETQYRPANLLSVVPWQGLPLAPDTLYATVVLRDARTDVPLAQTSFMRALIQGHDIDGLNAAARDDFARALSAVEASGVPADSIAAMSALRTADPMAELRDAFSVAQSDRLVPGPTVELIETHEEFCVYRTTAEMPVYQEGAPPFSFSGGGFGYGPDGRVRLQNRERAHVYITLPRRPPPPGGFPTVVFIRTGGGGDRPLIDRGVTDGDGNELEVGAGPARIFAQEGYAAISVDGPHGGLRNVLDADEQVLMFNFVNPLALRDNIRQTALEQALIPTWLGGVQVEAEGCAGLAGPATFDTERLVLAGHSMGATVAPLAAALEPRFRALILSGSGASWIENILYKRLPFPIRELAESLIGYLPYELERSDPTLSLVQWAADAADPINYNRYLLQETDSPRHILMFEGMVDRYILPPIANAQSASLGLDMAGEPLDERTPEVQDMQPLRYALGWSGRSQLGYPVRANRNGVTAVVVQHPEDEARDGHEVMFQTDGPKVQYRCFLRTLLTDEAPTVVDPALGCD